MDKTKIDWCDMSWNPITGCRHGCEYCYARRIAARYGGWTTSGVKTTDNYFKDPPELDKPLLLQRKDGKTVNAPYPFGFEPTLHRYRLGEPAKKIRPRNIFVGSMADVFGEWVPIEWIAEIIDACLAAPQHNYLFLTKNPQRYIDLGHLALLPQESNFWYGCSITGPDESYLHVEKIKTFLSIEPLRSRLGKRRGALDSIDWVIVGAMTGPGAEKHQPQREWVEEIVEECRESGTPVFMKDNLAKVWGPELIREFPPELRKEDEDDDTETDSE